MRVIQLNDVYTYLIFKEPFLIIRFLLVLFFYTYFDCYFFLKIIKFSTINYYQWLFEIFLNAAKSAIREIIEHKKIFFIH